MLQRSKRDPSTLHGTEFLLGLLHLPGQAAKTCICEPVANGSADRSRFASILCYSDDGSSRHT
jgi:hypothetical protein